MTRTHGAQAVGQSMEALVSRPKSPAIGYLDLAGLVFWFESGYIHAERAAAEIVQRSTASGQVERSR